MKLARNHKGFTFVELLIASAIFSLVLILITTGVIRIGNQYYKVVLQARTQSVARSIVDELTRGVQMSGVEPTLPVLGDNGFCINDVQYRYVLLTTKTSSNRVFEASDQGGATCVTSGGFPVGTGRDLLPAGMRLQKLEMIYEASTKRFTVTVRVIATPETNGDDFLNSPSDPGASCKLETGSHFCAVSEISATVQKRI